jgi:hypothetical protein
MNGGTCSEETKAKIGESTKLKWQNEECATKMREGLRKGTETMKQKGAKNVEERECPICHNKFICKPWEKKIYCNNSCASKDEKTYMKGLNAAKEANAKQIAEKDSKNIERVKEWVINNKDLLINVKYNKLTFLSDLANYLNLKDVRSVQRIFNAKNRKELVNKLIEIMNN